MLDEHLHPFLSIRVPGNPIGKARARILRTGRSYTPAPTKAWEASAALIAKAARQAAAPVHGPLYLYVVAWMPIPASWSKRKQADALSGKLRPVVKPDADNILKIVGDALTKVVWNDDAQVVEASVRKAYARDTGVVIHVGRV